LRIKPVFEGHILSQTVNSANSLKRRHLPAAGRKGPIYALGAIMEHITFDFLLGFLLAVALMVVLWVPLFFFDYKAEKKRGATPVGSGENPPTPPLDKVHLD
jgi:hypothetical protein